MKRNKLKQTFDSQAISKFYRYRKAGKYGRKFAVKNKIVYRYTRISGTRFCIDNYQFRSKTTSMQYDRQRLYKGYFASRTSCFIRSLFLNGK